MRPIAMAATCSVLALAIVAVPHVFTAKNTKVSKQKTETGIPQKNVHASAPATATIPGNAIVTPVETTKKKEVAVTIKRSHAGRNEFVYEPNSSGKFTGTQGTQIWIPGHAFVDAANGKPVTTAVDIKLEEFYAMDDIILKGLHTMSDKGLLETNGMIHLTASSNGRSCKLGDSKTITIGFPMVNNKPDMQLFWKEENDIEAVWQSASFTGNGILTPPADGIEIPPSLSNGLTSLRQYLVTYIGSTVESWNGKMEVEIFVSPWGATDSVKVLNELSDDATALVGVALKKLIWKKGLKNQMPVSFRARLQFDFLRDRGLTKVKFTQPFTYAPYQPPPPTAVRQFASSTLGWINCDRFYLFTQKTDFKVNIATEGFPNVSIVFNNYKAIMNGQSEQSGYTFKNVPANEPITVVAIKKEKGKYLLAQEQTNTSAGMLSSLEYVAMTKDQLRDALLNLDKVSKPVAGISTTMP